MSSQWLVLPSRLHVVLPAGSCLPCRPFMTAPPNHQPTDDAKRISSICGCLHDRTPSSPRAHSSSTRPTARPPCRRAPAVADAALEGACPVQCRRRRRVRWVAYDNREGRLCPPQVAGERRSSSVLARALLGLRWTGPGPRNRFKLKIVQF